MSKLDDVLVIGIASSALFNLSEGHRVFTDQGVDAYRDYQLKNRDAILNPGTAFEFVRKLLALNDLAKDRKLVEVVLLSRNSPDTGRRIMTSIKHYGLDMSRAVFTQGRSPYIYHEAFEIDLFLSEDDSDVREAIKLGCPAGRVYPAREPVLPAQIEHSLTIAFDFDGVLADDSSERVYAEGDLQSFLIHEVDNMDVPAIGGPIKPFFMAIAGIQALETQRKESDPTYQRRLRSSIVTARNSPADLRVLNTLESWGVTVDDAFFLGGLKKGPVLSVLKPDIFFDDQKVHIEDAAKHTMSAHVVFGVRNEKTSTPVHIESPSSVSK
ncbi:5'-nucleotidase [Pseudarthrobacter sp. MDT3-26]|uniref:5'-nucleotidase n=1 Tax=Pseudarthrobacter raffinosi TaxID=2953651 RepID=UPI00208FA26E|nr:5'-nucleotidase [Pseudarthrobacter sp. MDT3-26]MCO4261936.1 5'-nucleotidase [Pseudarthrobacter sp. MDT3-26]